MGSLVAGMELGAQWDECALCAELFRKPILPGISALPYSPSAVRQPQEGVSTGLE